MLLKELKAQLDTISSKGTARDFYPVLSRSAGKVTIGNKTLTDFTSWDILGINHLAQAIKSAHQGIEQHGVGVPYSRAPSGNYPELVALETRLSRFLGCEAALTFPSKNQAFLTLFTHLLSELDTVFVEDFSSTPIADAAHIVGAEIVYYKNENIETLQEELDKRKISKGRKIVFVDAISHAVNLREITTISKQNGAEVIVDESYTLGQVGVRGAGLTEECGVIKDIFCIIGSLNFSLCGFGGFVAGSNILISYLIEHSRSIASESPLPPAIVSPMINAIDTIESALFTRQNTASLASKLRTGAEKLGLSFLDITRSATLFMKAPSNSHAKEISKKLYQNGFLVEPSVMKRVREAQSYIKIIVNCFHKEADIDSLLKTLAEQGQKALNS